MTTFVAVFVEVSGLESFVISLGALQRDDCLRMLSRMRIGVPGSDHPPSLLHNEVGLTDVAVPSRSHLSVAGAQGPSSMHGRTAVALVDHVGLLVMSSGE